MPSIKSRLAKLEEQIPPVKFDVYKFLDPRVSGLPRSVGNAKILLRHYQLMTVIGLREKTKAHLRTQILKLGKTIKHDLLHEQDDERTVKHRATVDEALSILEKFSPDE